MALVTLREIAEEGVAQALRTVIQEVAIELFRSDPVLRERVKEAILEAFQTMSQAKAAAGFARARTRKS